MQAWREYAREILSPWEEKKFKALLSPNIFWIRRVRYYLALKGNIYRRKGTKGEQVAERLYRALELMMLLNFNRSLLFGIALLVNRAIIHYLINNGSSLL